MATILCIDDNLCILEIHRPFLGHKGYTVLTATDGLTGIALTRDRHIDLVVLDFNMPGIDGNHVAQVLMKEHPTLPVVICSGYLDDIPECLKWFADASLRKADGPILCSRPLNDSSVAKYLLEELSKQTKSSAPNRRSTR